MEAKDEWKKAGLGENRTMQVYLASPASAGGVVDLRYNPMPPFWVLGVSLLSLVAVALVGVLGTKSPRDRRPKGRTKVGGLKPET